MKKLLMCFAILSFALPAFADGFDTFIEWPNWKITSNEDLFLGIKHTSYPLTYLVDGDPNTAWVFSGTGKHEEEDTRPREPWVQFKCNAVMDSVWIMNGYNRRPELFARNNRIVEVQLVINNKTVKTVALTDKMGWHKISISRQRVRMLRMVSTKQVKGPDNDTCVSEIAFYDGQKKVDVHLPQAVVFSTGGECGDDADWAIIDRSGKKLLQAYSDDVVSWIDCGKYLSGFDEKTASIWVFDAVKGHIIYRRPAPLRSKDDTVDELAWSRNNSIIVEMSHPMPSKNDDDSNDVIYTKTITIPSVDNWNAKGAASYIDRHSRQAVR